MLLLPLILTAIDKFTRCFLAIPMPSMKCFAWTILTKRSLDWRTNWPDDDTNRDDDWILSLITMRMVVNSYKLSSSELLVACLAKTSFLHPHTTNMIRFETGLLHRSLLHLNSHLWDVHHHLDRRETLLWYKTMMVGFVSP